MIDLYSNLSRAYEIALMGNLTIQVMFDKSYLKGFDDYEEIKSFYGSLVWNTNGVKFVKDGDIVIEICQPYNYTSKTKDSLKDILDRVKKAKTNKTPSGFRNEACDSLLTVAVKRLNLSLRESNKAIEISSVIAKLEGTDKIEAYHIAEAIQYMSNDETLCNAEEKTINFGGGIKINLHELDTEDIEKAINYLKNLI